MPNDQFLSSSAWKKLREQTRNRWRRAGLPCALCNEPLDYAKGQTSVDHKQPRSKRPDLALEPSNLQVVHKRCHDSTKQAMEKGSERPQIGSDGFPIESEWS